MSAKELLEQATPLPWAHHDGVILTMRPDDSREIDQDADYDLIVYAVNRLPEYEAAVDALERALTAWEQYGSASGAAKQLDDAVADSRAALARLRDEVPA